MWVNCPNLIRVRPYNFFEVRAHHRFIYTHNQTVPNNSIPECWEVVRFTNIALHPLQDVGDINDPNGYAGNKKGPPCNGSNPVATFSKNKPLTMQQSDFCFQWVLPSPLYLPFTSPLHPLYIPLTSPLPFTPLSLPFPCPQNTAC